MPKPAQERSTVYVYALKDPRDLAVRYVGVTANPKQRLSFHWGQHSNPDHAVWFGRLRALKLRPIFDVLETLEGVGSNAAGEREGFWIRRFADLASVLNVIGNPNARAPGTFYAWLKYGQALPPLREGLSSESVAVTATALLAHLDWRASCYWLDIPAYCRLMQQVRIAEIKEAIASDLCPPTDVWLTPSEFMLRAAEMDDTGWDDWRNKPWFSWREWWPEAPTGSRRDHGTWWIPEMALNNWTPPQKSGRPRKNKDHPS